MKIIEHSPKINLDDFMKKPLFAHLATTSESGSAESPVWCLWKDGCLWVCTDIVNDSFGKRIEKDERCAIGIVDYDAKTGKLYHVGFRGIAKVIDFDVDIGTAVFAKYLGENKGQWPNWFNHFLKDQNARLIQFIPKTAVIRDRSYTAIR